MRYGANASSTGRQWPGPSTIGAASSPACTTCPSTRETIALTRYAQERGADGVVLVVPPYVTPPQEAVYEHFLAVAEGAAATPGIRAELPV